MTERFQEYVTSRIRDELTALGIDITGVSFRFEDGETYDDIDFDGTPYKWTNLDSVWVYLPYNRYSKRTWRSLYQLEDKLYHETCNDLKLTENGFYIAWVVKKPA